MGKVVLSPNIKKESVKINVNGDEITDFKTKKVIKKNEPEFVIPTKVETKEVSPSPLGELIKQKINAKLEKLIEEKIDEALKGL